MINKSLLEEARDIKESDQDPVVVNGIKYPQDFTKIVFKYRDTQDIVEMFVNNATKKMLIRAYEDVVGLLFGGGSLETADAIARLKQDYQYLIKMYSLIQSIEEEKPYNHGLSTAEWHELYSRKARTSNLSFALGHTPEFTDKMTWLYYAYMDLEYVVLAITFFDAFDSKTLAPNNFEKEYIDILDRLIKKSEMAIYVQDINLLRIVMNVYPVVNKPKAPTAVIRAGIKMFTNKYILGRKDTRFISDMKTLYQSLKKDDLHPEKEDKIVVISSITNKLIGTLCERVVRVFSNHTPTEIADNYEALIDVYNQMASILVVGLLEYVVGLTTSQDNSILGLPQETVEEVMKIMGLELSEEQIEYLPEENEIEWPDVDWDAEFEREGWE
jgi:hypothetical protein